MGYDRGAALYHGGWGNHRPPVSEIAAACEALHALKEEGLIQNIGVSCHDLGAFAKIAEVIEATDLLDYMMIRYNWKICPGLPNVSSRSHSSTDIGGGS